MFTFYKTKELKKIILYKFINLKIMSVGNTNIPIYIKSPLAGISGMLAAIFVHPLDLLKNNMQVTGIGVHVRTSTDDVFMNIYKTAGIRGFYTGLSAGLLRQATYGSVRMGVYLYLADTYHKQYNKQPDFYKKVCFGCMAGIIGSLFGNPAEVILIRMTSDFAKNQENRRNYKNALEGVWRVAREEGIFTLWRGLYSNMSRAVVANAVELSAYSQAKQILMNKVMLKDDFKTYLLSAAIASVANVSVSLPFDIVKTRIQNIQIVTKHENIGTLRILKGIVQKEGITALWKGYLPCLSCIGPRTILMFVFFEHLCQAFNINVLKIEH